MNRKKNIVKNEKVVYSNKSLLSSIKIILLLFLCFIIFSKTIEIHNGYVYPLHVDEWYHLSESISIKEGDGNYNEISSLRVGFHFFLYFLSFFMNLVENYYIFASIWSILTVLVIFLVFKKLTNNFWIGFLTALIYSLVGTNINLLGKNFFTPLAFAIPFIYLYTFLIIHGIENNKTKYFILGIIIATLLIPFHAISISFMIIPLFIYFIIRKEFFIKKLDKRFSIFFIALFGSVGVLFFSFVFNGFFNGLSFFFRNIFFKKGFGVFEYNNSFFELYNPFVFLFMFIGLFIFTKEIFLKDTKIKLKIKQILNKKDILYFIWLTVMFFSIIFFRITGFSPMSPYQRNMYYLALVIPYFSALAIVKIFTYIHTRKNKTLRVLLLSLILFLIYLMLIMPPEIPTKVGIYRPISYHNIDVIKSTTYEGTGYFIAPIQYSHTIYPFIRKRPIATNYFYGNSQIIYDFYSCEECECFERILIRHNIDTIFSEDYIDCNWKELSSERPFIYNFKR